MNLIQYLESFDSISLEEMDRVKLLRRIDVKYLISKTNLIDLLKKLTSDYYVLEINGKRIASYHTKYFDTVNKNFYLQHHQGKLKRHKVRFRTYIDLDLSFLEVKLKYKGKTNKKRISSNMTDMLDEYQRAFLSTLIRENPKDLCCSLENTFQRITFAHKLVTERVTIDFDLQFESKNKKIKLKDQIILEVKQSEASRNTLMSKLLREKYIRPLRISKYCIGSVLIDKKLKYNRFKSRLLKINKIKKIWTS